jgi:hypothetical protein
MPMKLPNKIFVKWDNVGSDDPFLNANRMKSELAEKGETETIGEYKLVRVSKVALKVVETDGENVIS